MLYRGKLSLVTFVIIKKGKIKKKINIKLELKGNGRSGVTGYIIRIKVKGNMLLTRRFTKIYSVDTGINILPSSPQNKCANTKKIKL